MKYQNFNYGGAGVLDYLTIGSSSYHALQAILITRYSKSLTGLMNYTFSKSMDDSSNGTSIANSSDQPTGSAHHAISDFNSRHIFNFGAVYRFPDTTSAFAPMRAILNGWAANAIYTARTGHPFSVTSNADQELRDEKPEYVGLPPGGYRPLASNRHRVDKVAEWFNTSPATGVCLPEEYSNGTGNSCPNAMQYGNAPRNFLIGPAYISTQLGIFRTFTLKQDSSKRFVLRVDAFNAFNTPNLGQPQSTESATAAKNNEFGTIISTVGGNGAVGTNGRRLQLSGTIFF